MKDRTNNLEETQFPALQEQNLSRIIEQTSHHFSNKTAVVYREQILTYAQLNTISNQFANYLLSSGIKKGDIIGLAVECSIEMLVCMLGMLRAGAIYIPLDPKYPKERIEYMLHDSGAKMLLITKANCGKFQSPAAENVIEQIWPELGNYDTEVSFEHIFDSGLAYILYTSGSTGKPKGVEITHSNLINLLTSIQSKPGITAADRLLAITTISFDIAGLELFLPLLVGAELIISDLETARDGRLLLDILEEKNITIMQATPSTWRMMIDAGWSKTYPVKVFCGGETMPRDLADQLLERSAQVWNMYGPTETTIYSTIKQITKEERVITIGKPINNTQIYLYDDKQQPVTAGNTGEIYIGGAGVATGYLNHPQLTAERFVPDPFSANPSAKLYRTGDLGKELTNGDIEYFGRIDQQVKIRGHRIELGEIENILLSHPDIKQAVVIAREDNPDDKRLVAYLILQKTAGLTVSNNIIDIQKAVIESFKETLKQNLPDYMIPNDYVVLKTLPLTPNHKIDKKELPRPPQKRSLINVGHLPKDENERIVASIWTKALGMKNLSTQDDFFDLGGNSLLAVKIMSGIEKKTGKRLPLATLFDNTTIEKLARKISSDEESRWLALVPIKTTGTKDPIYLIHGGGLNIMLFKSMSRYFDPEQPVYGLQALGLNKQTQLLDTVEEIAAVYINEIIESNPNGPYSLAGYSLGGLIAWEMGKQLEEKGKSVKFLGIMDTYAGNADHNYTGVKKMISKAKRQFSKVPFLIRSFINHPKEAAAYQLLMIKNRIFKQGTDIDLPELELFSPYEKEIYRTYKTAQNNYQLKQAALQITLFKVRKRLYFLDDLKYLGWTRIAANGVNVNEVPGDHKTFLYAPHNQHFAKILQAELNRL